MHPKIGKVLVVGAGIGGIRSALDLAECGYRVALIDEAPHIGGLAAKLDRQFPSDRCGMCKMLPLVRRDSSSQFCMRKGFFHDNIELMTGTELISAEGGPGDFEVSLRQASAGVDPARCVGCGLCARVCPVEVPDPFNEGMSARKAIFAPVPHAAAAPYVIDASACDRCGKCAEICPADAVRLSAGDREGFRILVVDDELIVRDSLKELLADDGFSADMADSGAQALEMLASGSYHLMLTDIKMPGMDGVELLRAAREADPDLCVVMMTAYATVETAVEAMKIGARDYLLKPFEPEVLVPMIEGVHAERMARKDLKMRVGAVVLNTGVSFFDPSEGKNVFRYGRNPGVVTNLEFERMLSGTGPFMGRALVSETQEPPKRIAWIQCVGSRDLANGRNFCSSVCCMIAVKQALLAGEKIPGLEASVFYMDLRAYGKSFQDYVEEARSAGGVEFVRGRAHSVAEGDGGRTATLRFMDEEGRVGERSFDLVVLSVGQKPSESASRLAEALDLERNPWGFLKSRPFFPARSSRDGVFLGGSAAGFKDIAESVICASAAANEARRIVHTAGGSLAPAETESVSAREASDRQPVVFAALCVCGDRLGKLGDPERIASEIEAGTAVDRTLLADRLCSPEGWDKLIEAFEKSGADRLLVGACHPYAFVSRLKRLHRKTGLDPSFSQVADLGHVSDPGFGEVGADCFDEGEKRRLARRVVASMRMAAASLEDAAPSKALAIPVAQRALVVGGGIAGMRAALSVADLGYPVDLVEKSDRLGGNLLWLRRTLDGSDVREFLAETEEAVRKHPQISLHLETRVAGAFGEVGRFLTTLEDAEGRTSAVEHGATILAVGGSEAETRSFGMGEYGNVVTQSQLERRLEDGSLEPEKLGAVVMIQCVDSREPPRNYCSRICCAGALKNALALKEAAPDIQVYVLHRDVMVYGFDERRYTEAREKGVVFFAWDPEGKPKVGRSEGGALAVEVFDKVLRRPVSIEADLAVLATGIVSNLSRSLAEAYGARRDRYGFFQEAESKWRPLDSLREGVFACGAALSPRTVPESVASAQAAAQRALRILSAGSLPAGKVLAKVRRALCNLCEKCVEACPYQARSLDLDEEKILVNPAMCQGCGTCAALCPNDASYLEGFRARAMLNAVGEALYGKIHREREPEPSRNAGGKRDEPIVEKGATRP